MLRNSVKLIIAILVCELAGIIGGVFTVPAIQGWYATLIKPSFNPPSWVFGPVWTVLYALMGISLFLIWKRDHSVAPKERRRGIVLFFGQLILNTFWSIVFFGLEAPGWAFVVIILMWFAILATMVAFAKISKPTMYLLLPYLLWVTFASVLNFSIWFLNK